MVDEPAPALADPAWTADSAVDGWHARRTPAWSIRADEHDVYEPAPVPVPVEEVEEVEVREFVRAPDPETAAPTSQVVAAAALAADPVAAAAHRPGPFRAEPQRAERPAPEPDGAAPGADRRGRRADTGDPHAALEARILLPARKDR
jgi:hypothetical protein